MAGIKKAPSLVFLIIAFLIGGYIRLSQVVRVEYPINDGGMFYTMTRELQANGYRLPETTNYNGLDVPFAYPPLGFYLAGLLTDLAGWSLLDIFRLLPAVLSVLTIPAFFLFARELVKSESHLSLAVLIFALLPAAFDWLIMGGGITRAPGFLFSLLTLFCIHRLYTRREIRYVFWTSILAAATVMFHPEDALHTVASALVFWWFLGRSRAGILKSLSVAGLTLLITSPWWISVMINHGITPFLAAGSTGWHSIEAAINLLGFNLTGEIGLQTMGVLALIGLFIALAQKKYFLPVWTLVIFVSEPRSAPLYLTPVMAIFASAALEEILTLLARLGKGKSSAPAETPVFTGAIPRIALAVLLAQWVLSASMVTIVEANTMSLTRADDGAFSWIRMHTPIDSSFLVITGMKPLTDPVSEWFPALAERISAGTAQGHEWNHPEDFNEVLIQARDLQRCAYRGPACLADWQALNRIKYEYVFIRKIINITAYRMDVIDSGLQESLLASGSYSLVYDTPEISILHRIP